MTDEEAQAIAVRRQKVMALYDDINNEQAEATAMRICASSYIADTGALLKERTALVERLWQREQMSQIVVHSVAQGKWSLQNGVLCCVFCGVPLHDSDYATEHRSSCEVLYARALLDK